MRRLLLVSLLLGLACARPAAEPSQVVATYLRSLGRDPLRAIERVTPGFQERHGLRLAASAQVERWQERVREGAPAPPPPALSAAPPTPDEARLSWLSVQVKPAFRDELARLAWHVGVAQRDDDRHASVMVRIEPVDAPAFEQIFHLVRGDGSGSWRIDRVEQQGVGAANLAAAFVANPTEELRRRLAAQLGVAPE